jgi:hypothetical protein
LGFRTGNSVSGGAAIQCVRENFIKSAEA